MVDFQINNNEAGQRFDKYLKKILKEAPDSFIYKMLRKKNITLNGKKAEGKEILSLGDEVKIFLADETFEKFSGKKLSKVNQTNMMEGISQKECKQYQNAYHTLSDITIIYEDENVLICNKPAGILSQKASANDISVNEWLLGYLLEKKAVTPESMSFFKPSVCNRLDRNTSGMVVCGKSLIGSQYLSRIIKEKRLEKYYYCIVPGTINMHERVSGYLWKNQKTNKVSIYKEIDEIPKDKQKDASYIDTKFVTDVSQNNHTLIEAQLFTGKTHQIRAHLSSLGHPIIGDCKYGDEKINNKYKKYGIKGQMLHAYKLVFPAIEEEQLRNLSEKTIICPMPDVFHAVLEDHAK